MFNGNCYSLADIAAVSGNDRGSGNGMWGDGSWLWIIVVLALLGWGGNGFGGFGGFGGNGGVANEVQRGFDNQSVLNKLNGLENGLCDGFYAQNTTMLQGFNGLQQSIMGGFHGVDNAICTLGYQNQQGINSLSSQLASCCCGIERSIDGNTTQGVMNTNAIQKQISDCCCDLEKMNMQNRFDAQAYNCNTLQAIDKLGDRIIDYMNAEKTQALRDENQALRLAASQAKQNQYLINEIRPCPIPAYITCNPYAGSYGYGYNNGCGCGCA